MILHESQINEISKFGINSIQEKPPDLARLEVSENLVV
jgi:hypothetical protein